MTRFCSLYSISLTPGNRTTDAIIPNYEKNSPSSRPWLLSGLPCTSHCGLNSLELAIFPNRSQTPKLHPTSMAPKSVLITGCSEGGIGGALAEAFQERGLHVFATARTPSKMPNLAKRPNVTILTLDVTVQSSITAAVEAVKAYTGGTLDYLVNNSGCGLFMPVLDVEIAQAKRLFDTNLWGALDVTQQFAPLLIAAGGTLVNINSITTHVYCPWISK